MVKRELWVVSYLLNSFKKEILFRGSVQAQRHYE